MDGAEKKSPAKAYRTAQFQIVLIEAWLGGSTESPYQCVLAKVSLVGRRSAEPVCFSESAFGNGFDITQIPVVLS